LRKNRLGRRSEAKCPGGRSWRQGGGAAIPFALATFACFATAASALPLDDDVWLRLAPPSQTTSVAIPQNSSAGR